MSEKPTLCSIAQTIRTTPSNHLLAHLIGNRWVCEPDMAINSELAVRCFTALLKFSTRYGTGDNLIKAINEMEKKEASPSHEYFSIRKAVRQYSPNGGEDGMGDDNIFWSNYMEQSRVIAFHSEPEAREFAKAQNFYDFFIDKRAHPLFKTTEGQ